MKFSLLVGSAAALTWSTDFTDGNICDASSSISSAWTFGSHTSINGWRSKGLCEDYCIEQYWAQTTETASCCEYFYFNDYDESGDEEAGVECYFYEAAPGTHSVMPDATLEFYNSFFGAFGVEMDSFGAWTMAVGEVEGAMKFGASLVAAAALAMTLY